MKLLIFDEHIKFTKIEDHKTKELLLLDRIKELEDQHNNLIFAYKLNSSDVISFNVNSTELDFRPFYDNTKTTTYYEGLSSINYNRFRKVKKIITNQISYNFSSETIIHRMIHYCDNGISLYLPSVTELVIYINKNDDRYLCSSCYINYNTFPNLEKIYYINDGYIKKKDTDIVELCCINHHKSYYAFKKLKLVSFENFIKHNMINTYGLTESKLYAQANNIKLEIT